MIKSYLLVHLTLLPVASLAQGKIVYRYDASGNRVKREIAAPVSKAMARLQTLVQEEQNISDMFHDNSIKIYSNPTKGNLKVCISNVGGTDKCSLSVYTPLGQQVLTKTVDSENTDIDISSHPTGVYMLRITINDNPMTWKITKK